MFSAAIRGDDAAIAEGKRELEQTQGRLIGNSFPVLVGAKALKDSLAEKLKSAKSRIDRFMGGDGRAVVDERAALAIDHDDGKKRGAGAEIPGGGPLPVSTGTVFVAKRSEPAADHSNVPGGWTDSATGRSRSWTEWAANEHRTRPHCYGIVDPENLAPDCPNREAVGKAAASGTAGTGQESQVAGVDRGTGESAAEGGKWSERDKSAGYVSDVDRESAQVSVFAVRCWGVPGVNEYHPFYPIMKKRMQRNDCLKEEAEGKLRGDATKEYAAVLADTLAEDGAAEGGGDYRDALSSLETREAERQARLEKRRKAAERERRRLARVEEQRRNEEIERENRRLDALEAEQRRKAIRNVAESLRNFTRQMAETYGGRESQGTSDCPPGHRCPHLWD